MRYHVMVAVDVELEEGTPAPRVVEQAGLEGLLVGPRFFTRVMPCKEDGSFDFDKAVRVSDPDCPFCEGKGWADCFEGEVIDGTKIQACDACGIYETDQAAWVAARLAGWQVDDEGGVMSSPDESSPVFSARNLLAEEPAHAEP